MLNSEDIDFLDDVVARLTDLDTRWNTLVDMCVGIPPTLVHGDFNGKNVRLRRVNHGSTIFVFDWEEAGFGVPAVDLAQQAVPSSNLSANPDLASYWATVREEWPKASPEAVRRLAHCGTVFRALAALYWESFNLNTEWASRFISNIRLYDAELVHALARLGWDRAEVSLAAAGEAALDGGP